MAEKIDIDKLAELKEGLDGTKESQDKYNTALDLYIKQMKEANKEKEKATVLDFQLAQAQSELAEMFGDTLGAYEANNEALRIAQELQDAVIDSTKELTAEQIEQIESVYGSEEALAAEIEQLKAKKKAIDDLGPAYKKALKTSKPFFEDTAVKLGLLSKKGNKFAKTLGSMFKMAGEKGGLKGLAKGFTEAFNPLNIGISIITKVVEATFKMMFAVDKAGASFTKTTGFARNFDELIASTNVRMRQFGVTAEDAQKAIAELRQGLSQFTTLGTSTQEKLTDIVTGLEKIGVKAADSVKTIQSLNKSFDISADTAADMARDLALSGDALGKTASSMTKDFNKSLSTLAVYGPKSVKIFKNIASMAAAAGVEVDDMLSIANKFDTFADSAKTAAKMNAILGTSFSGVNMMMMDHDKRTEHVIRGLQRTGVQFKKLDKFTQQAIATQLGFKDMDKARKILGMNVGEYRRLQEEQAATAAEQEALNEKMSQAMSVVDKLKVIMMDFAINMEPMIPKIKELVEGFGEFIKGITPMGLLLSGIGSAMVGLAMNTGGLIMKIKMMEKFGGSAIKGLSKSIAKGLTTVSAAASKSAPSVGALSISMGGIALTIGVAGAAVSGIALAMAHLFETLIQGTIALHESGVGFEAVASSLLLFAAAIFGISKAVTALAASSAALTATGPIGLAIGGAIAGIGGVAFGIGALMSKSKNTPKPKMDTSELIKSAEVLKGLSTDLQYLVDKRSEIEDTFAAVGAGLERTKAKLTTDIKSTIANVALITTGQAAGEMTQGAAGAALSRNLGKFIDSVGNYFTGQENDKGKAVKITLDEKATNAFIRGQQAIGHMKP